MTPDPYALDLAPIGSDLDSALVVFLLLLIGLLLGVLSCRRIERQKQNRLREHRKTMWEQRQQRLVARHRNQASK